VTMKYFFFLFAWVFSPTGHKYVWKSQDLWRKGRTEGNVKTEQIFLESGILKYNVCVWVMEVMDGWTESETLRRRERDF